MISHSQTFPNSFAKSLFIVVALVASNVASAAMFGADYWYYRCREKTVQSSSVRQSEPVGYYDDSQTIFVWSWEESSDTLKPVWGLCDNTVDWGARCTQAHTVDEKNQRVALACDESKIGIVIRTNKR